MKQQLAAALERAGLLRPAARVYDEAAYLRSRARAPRAADAGELPVPPPRLIWLVAHTADPRWYLESGRRAAASLAGLLERHGRPIAGRRSILDFGCGCGRVIRHWRDLPGEVAGSDLEPRAVAWCSANLPFARFSANALAPPLAFGDAAFDLVYGLSVLTHLTEELEAAWLAELARVVEPGGSLVLSLHGEAYRERLDARERAAFDAGRLVVRRAGVAGSNLCSAFHPPAYVRERVAGAFRVVAYEPEGALGNPRQDLWLLERA